MKSIEEFKNDFKEAIPYLRKKFNLTRSEAEMLERQYRIETAHFKSGQGRGTFSPGMEKFGEKFPYGWISLNKFFWSKFPEHSPKDFFPYIEGGTGKTKYFLKFPDVKSAMATVLHNARMKNGKFEAWYSNNPNSQERYKKVLLKIKPRIINKIW